MASKKFEKGSEEYEFFKDFYNFMQKYWIPEEEDEWWEEVVRESGILINKHNTRLARDMFQAFELSRDRVLKGEKA